MIERIERAGAHRHERLPEQNELDDFHRSRRAARRFARQRSDAGDPRVGKDRRIKRRSLLRFVGVPEKWNDHLNRHDKSPVSVESNGAETKGRH